MTSQIEQLKKIHENYTSGGEPFDSDYAWGFCNGLEAAIALLEQRPPFYLDKNSNYGKIDQEKYPEYFM